jgi:hypothetical protein
VPAIEVAASGIGTGNASHRCAISHDRLTAWCWDRNDMGQLGNGATTTGPAASPAPSIVIGQKPLWARSRPSVGTTSRLPLSERQLCRLGVERRA